jgi:hypothetical protein
LELQGAAAHEYLLLSGAYAGVILFGSVGVWGLTHPHFNIGMSFVAMLTVVDGYTKQCLTGKLMKRHWQIVFVTLICGLIHRWPA